MAAITFIADHKVFLKWRNLGRDFLFRYITYEMFIFKANIESFFKRYRNYWWTIIVYAVGVISSNIITKGSYLNII